MRARGSLAGQRGQILTVSTLAGKLAAPIRHAVIRRKSAPARYASERIGPPRNTESAYFTSLRSIQLRKSARRDALHVFAGVRCGPGEGLDRRPRFLAPPF